jgi:uncharacterized membrane protein YbhN (UPF0104 family)
VQKGTWLRVGVTGAAAAILVWRLPPASLLAEFRRFDSTQLLPVAACLLAMLAVRGYKWHSLVSAGQPGARAQDSLRSLLGGFALSIVTPGRLGEFGRCLFVPRRDRLRTLLLNVLDRLLDMWALLTFGVVSLFLLVHFPPAIFGVGVWLAELPLLVGLPALIATFVALPPWPERLRAPLSAATPHLLAVRVPRYAALSVASTALDLMLFFFLLRSFHPVNIDAALATFPWIVIASGLPISLSGLGVREGMATLLLARYGLPAAAAVDVGLLFFAFNTLLPAAAGGLWLLAGGSLPNNEGSSDLGTLWKGIWSALRPAASRPAGNYCRE